MWGVVRRGVRADEGIDAPERMESKVVEGGEKEVDGGSELGVVCEMVIHIDCARTSYEFWGARLTRLREVRC